MNTKNKMIAVNVEFGLSGSCLAELEESAMEGMEAGNLLSFVAEVPQETEAARRTAKMVAAALKERRKLDVEVVRGNQQNGDHGEPIELDEPIIKHKKNAVKPDSLTVRVSEPYKGG